MKKAILYKRFPLLSILLYNGTTVLHFFIGGVILLYLHRFWGAFSIVAAAVYFILSMLEMYLLMPLSVCRHCVYFRMENGLCISGMNIVTKKLVGSGNPLNFPNRAKGPFCPNNLYIVSLLLPLLYGIPILIVNFTRPLLYLVGLVFILLVVRFMLIVPKLACVHCLSKFVCPQAGQMGVREK